MRSTQPFSFNRRTAHAAVVTLLVSLISCTTETPTGRPDSPPAPDLIVVNAEVHTADRAAPLAEGFAVTSGRFTSIGSAEDLLALAGPKTIVIDAEGAAALPGFVDGHTHLVLGSDLATGVDLSEVVDKTEWLTRISDKASNLPKGTWILGGAWDHNLSDGVLPTKEMLDSVAPDHPVFLADIDGHTGWANSLAIKLARVTATSSVEAGGEIVLDSKTGEPSGIFKESAMALIRSAPGMAEAKEPKAGIRAATALANRYGITTVHDMSGSIEDYLAVLEEGALTVRVWEGLRPDVHADQSATEQYEEMAALRDEVKARVAAIESVVGSGPRFEIGYTKLMIDGVLSMYTALMKEPYADRPEATAEPFVEKDVLLELIQTAHEHQFPVAVHAIGDEAVSWVLDGFEASPALSQGPGDRIEHIEVVTPGDIKRFGALGVAASMQPHHATCCVGNYVLERVGTERLANTYAWRAMLDSGVGLVLGSDWPTSPMNPLIQIADTMHRETSSADGVGPWDEGQTLTFEEALYGYTQAGANATSWSDDIGSIAIGKWADFILLDAPITGATPRALAERLVDQTYLAGERVYSRHAE